MDSKTSIAVISALKYKLENKDEFITNINYTIDLSQKPSVDSLSKNKFTSYLHFPS